MKRKKILIVLIYGLLVLGCAIVVLFMRHLVKEPDKESTLPTEESLAAESNAGKPGDGDIHTPADAKGQDAAAEAVVKPWWRNPQHQNQNRGQMPATEAAEVLEEEPYVPPTLMLTSDHHYMSTTMHDDGAAFQKMLAEDDGKASQYSDAMLDALMAEAIETRPSALILAGDLTFNGEQENHNLLAEKLKTVQDAGVPVLVIPGNHDINNQNAATYFGAKREKAEYLDTAGDFLAIYHEFGYDQALSRDEDSLSYMYALDDSHWLAMIDTCQYEDYNHVNGRLKPGTLTWLEEQLAEADRGQIAVLVVGHHNLLSESRMYTTECTMENHEQVAELLEQYQLPLYVSGHLHAQRIKKHKSEPGVAKEAYGINEIVLSAYSIAPNQYGYLSWNEQGDMAFETLKVDVAGFAASQGSTDENLLNFDTYSVEFIRQVMETQVKKTIGAVPDDIKEEMAALFSGLYYDYCAGNRMSWNQVKTAKSYLLWQRVSPDSPYVAKMGQMIEDVKEDLHNWSWKQVEEELQKEEPREDIPDETTDDRTGSVIR